LKSLTWVFLYPVATIEWNARVPSSARSIATFNPPSGVARRRKSGVYPPAMLMDAGLPQS